LATDEVEVGNLLQQVFGLTDQPESKAQVVKQLYMRAYPDFSGPLTEADASYLRNAIEDATIPLSWGVRFSLCSTLVLIRTALGLETASRLWETVPAESRLECLGAFADNTGTLFHFARRDPRCLPRPETFEWMINKLVEMPDLDHISDHIWYHFTEMAETLPKRPISWLNGVLLNRIHAAGDESASFRALSSSHRLTIFCQRISQESSSDENLRGEVETLVSFATKPGLVGYLLPKYVVAVDPEGILVPGILAQKIKATAPSDEDILHCWIRFGGYYPFNSDPWRTIAAATFEVMTSVPNGERGRFYAALLHAGVKSSSYSVGQMDPAPGESLKARKTEFETETNDLFLPFREWHLRIAQAEYDQAVAEYREEQESAFD